MRRALLPLLVLVTTTAPACAMLSGSRGRPSDGDIGPAEQRQDLPTLQRACKGELNVVHPEYACQAAERVITLQTPCPDLRRRYDDSHGEREGSSWRLLVARKTLACGLFTDLFDLFASDVEELEHDGTSLEPELVRYATDRQGARFLPTDDARVQMENLISWLTYKRSFQHCPLLVEAIRGRDELAFPLLGYARAAKCEAAVPLATSMLLSETYRDRVAACELLGDLGPASVAAKLAILAETDDHAEVREETTGGGTYGVNHYPVREACGAALGKLRLRLE